MTDELVYQPTVTILETIRSSVLECSDGIQGSVIELSSVQPQVVSEVLDYEQNTVTILEVAGKQGPPGPPGSGGSGSGNSFMPGGW
jgi:hypothetical protein